jgi:hypothetical protein
MAVLLAGAVLLLMGLFSGAVLVAAPLGLMAAPPSLSLWVLFPLFTLVGYMLTVAGSRTSRLEGLSFALSCGLLLLAVAAAVALVLSAASVIPLQGNTLSLWYVLVIAGGLGSIGAASRGSVARTS